MPAKAVKPESPPSPLDDRSEGWGIAGRVKGYNIKDNGEWPVSVVDQANFPDYPSETLDGTWSHELE